MDRQLILKRYQQELRTRWEKSNGRPSNSESDIEAVKLFCEMYGINVEEHLSTLGDLKIDPGEWIDANGLRVDEWLAQQRAELPPPTRGALASALSLNPRWQKALPPAPTRLQDYGAVAAAVVLVAALAGVLVTVF